MSKSSKLKFMIREALGEPFVNSIGSGMGFDNNGRGTYVCPSCGYQVNDFLGASLLGCPKCGTFMDNDQEDPKEVMKAELKDELTQELAPTETPDDIKKSVKKDLIKELKPKEDPTKIKNHLLSKIDKLTAELDKLKSQSIQAPPAQDQSSDQVPSEEPQSDQPQEVPQDSGDQTQEPQSTGDQDTSNNEPKSDSGQLSKKKSKDASDKALDALASLVKESLYKARQ